MTRSSTALRACICLVLIGPLGACSWFRGTPKTAVVAMPAADDRDVQPAAAAEAACANYARTAKIVPFPREAVIRGIDTGQASVRFAVDGTTVTILSVRSSDPAFGNAATDVVNALTCRVDHPTRFEVPFSWRTTR